jgi:type III secretion protein J
MKWRGRAFMTHVMAFFCCVVALVGCNRDRVIINGLDERDANEIVVFLASKNIDSHKVQVKSEGAGGGAILWDIAVDSSKATEAMAVLNANGLPRRRTERLLELFTSRGLVPSEMQEKIRFQAGLAEQIAGTIRKIDGILDADVQLSFPEEDPLNPKKTQGAVTASVFIKHQGVLDDPNSHLITKIRRLVASSVQGLNFENVTIIADRARFSDVNAQLMAQAANRGLEHVKAWGIILAKESLSRFQLVFFSFLAIISLLGMMTLWLLWKVVPIAKQVGGVKMIFSVHPLIDVAHLEGQQPPQETETPPAPSETAEKEPRVQENIESQ